MRGSETNVISYNLACRSSMMDSLGACFEGSLYQAWWFVGEQGYAQSLNQNERAPSSLHPAGEFPKSGPIWYSSILRVGAVI